MIAVGAVKSALVIQGLLLGQLFAVEAVLTLGSVVGENEIQIEATVGGISDTKTTVYSGSIELDLEIESDEVTSFQMTGGAVSASDVSFLFEVFPGFGQSVDYVDAASVPTSPSGAEALATPGQFSAPLHFFRFNEGCVESSGALGETKVLIADDPFDAAGKEVGQITLGAPTTVNSTLSNQPIATQYPVSLSLSLNSTATDTVDGITTVIVTTGTVTADGSALVYFSPFYEWAAANAPDAGLALAFDADADGDGVCDGIAWALGYEVGAMDQVPAATWNAVQEEFVFNLTTTTRHAMTLEASDELAAGSWLAVPGFAPIAQGTTGEISIPKAGKNFRFFRLVSDF